MSQYRDLDVKNRTWSGWKEVARALILLCYIVIIVGIALAYWPVLKVFLFIGIFFGLLFVMIVALKFIKSEKT